MSEKLPDDVGELDVLACPTTSDCVALQRTVAAGGVTVGPRTALSREAQAAASTPDDIVLRTTDGGRIQD